MKAPKKSSSKTTEQGDIMSMRYGKRIMFFVPYAKFEWYPATRCVFVKDDEYPIGTDAYNMQQARAIASSFLATQREEDFIHETDHTNDQEGDA
jgi:hypothetical protein